MNIKMIIKYPFFLKKFKILDLLIVIKNKMKIKKVSNQFDFLRFKNIFIIYNIIITH